MHFWVKKFNRNFHYLSRLIRKPTICICAKKGADQLRRNTAKLISTFVFATWILQFLYFLNPFPAFSHLLCMCSSVFVGPVWKPHCWFSHNVAHFIRESRWCCGRVHDSRVRGSGFDPYLCHVVSLSKTLQAFQSSGREVIKLFSSSAQLSMKFQLLVNVE